VERFDFLDQEHDRLAGGTQLVTLGVRESRSPASQLVDLVFVQTLAQDPSSRTSTPGRSHVCGRVSIGNDRRVPDVASCHAICDVRSMRITYFASAGAADPTRASIPLHLAANGSVELGHEVSIILGGDAAELLLEDTAERLEGVGVPPARELLAKLRQHDVPVYV
jgi:hypothetical protein